MALPLIETVTRALAPAARVPEAAERVTQFWVFEAAQLTEEPPLFFRVKARLEGLKGPPWAPEAFNPVAGVTPKVPAVTKPAVTLLAAFMVIVAGFAVPVRPPDQLPKLYPEAGEAVIVTFWPLLYQLVPAGLTVPPLDGLAEALRLCWVVKFAV